MSQHGTSTFSQRHGYEPVPQPLQLEELPEAARIAIWNVLYTCLANTRQQYAPEYIGEPWTNILGDLYVHHDSKPLDELNPGFKNWCYELRRRIEHHEFNHVFDLIEFIMRHPLCPREFTTQMSGVFERGQLAYIIDVAPPESIFPSTTREEGDQLKRNLLELHAAALDGCTAHLRQSSERISAKDWAGSIRESIHAVESVAKQVDGAKTLGQALNSLEKRGELQHKALKEAFSKLYGYTSDEKGIRHALADESANVTIDEAVFMLGACASFASYLWRKHKAAGDTP